MDDRNGVPFSNAFQEKIFAELNANVANELQTIGISRQGRQIPQKRDHIFFLGAGVSASLGMPLWDGLINEMLGEAFMFLASQGGSDYDPTHPEVMSNTLLWDIGSQMVSGELRMLPNVGPLEAAAYIDNLMCADSDPSMLKELVRRVIQRDSPHPVNPTTMETVADIIKKKSVRTIVNYNFDPLLQETLIAKGVPESEIFTHTGPQSVSGDGYNIYHVHGFVQRKRGSISTAFPGESENLILTEDSYHDLEQNKIYGWSSRIQSQMLGGESSGVFVGFSGEDYNFRRIVRFIGDSGVSHIILFVLDESEVERVAREVSCGYPDADEETHLTLGMSMLRQRMRMKSDYWAQRGLHAIWTPLQQLPEHLRVITDEW